MRLAEWVSDTREENENIDIFLQITRLLHDAGKGRGTVSPAFYKVDSLNDVTFTEDGLPEYDYSAPECYEEDGGSIEKSDVFSLGLLLHFILYQKPCPVNRVTEKSFFKPRRKNVEGSAFKAEDSKLLPRLIERMTSYNPESRPSLKEILSVIYSNYTCRFGIIRENVLTKERYIEIVRCFSERKQYIFVPEKEYTVDMVTIAPISTEPMTIPFRLVKKQYILPVSYNVNGRWSRAEKKENAAQIEELPIAAKNETERVHKATAALYFCDAVYGIEGDALFCESDGYSYKMGFYEHKGFNYQNAKEISIVKEGEIAVPERIEARILSILREKGKAVYDLFCVAVYGRQNPVVIKTINDLFPDAIRIYRLSDEDILKGASLYLNELHQKMK